MFKGSRIVPLGLCRNARRGPVNLVAPITQSIGRRVVIAMLGGSIMMGPRQAPEPDREGLEWCHRCERWYNPKGPHGCVEDDILANRDSLEQWLGKGKFKVKD